MTSRFLGTLILSGFVVIGAYGMVFYTIDDFLSKPTALPQAKSILLDTKELVERRHRVQTRFGRPVAGKLSEITTLLDELGMEIENDRIGASAIQQRLGEIRRELGLTIETLRPHEETLQEIQAKVDAAIQDISSYEERRESRKSVNLISFITFVVGLIPAIMLLLRSGPELAKLKLDIAKLRLEIADSIERDVPGGWKVKSKELEKSAGALGEEISSGIEGGISGRGLSSDLDFHKSLVLDGFVPKRFLLRSVLGLARDSGLSAERVEECLKMLEEKGLCARAGRKGLKWVLTPKGQAMLSDEKQDVEPVHPADAIAPLMLRSYPAHV